MVGAYQEILGDLHNLFGDTDSAHVEFDSHGGWQVNNKLYGDTVESVLKTVHFNKPELLSQYQSQLKQSDLTPEQQVNYFDILSSGLEGYTYFEL
jgi:arginine decarboxylase